MAYEVYEKMSPNAPEAFAHLALSPYQAVAELIDNAREAKIPNEVLDITVKTRSGRLDVIANNEYAPRPDDPRVFEYGSVPKASVSRYYGLGLKAATLYLGNDLEIRTQPPGWDHWCEARIRDWRHRDRDKPITFKDTPYSTNRPMFAVTVREVDKAISPTELRRRIGTIFKPDLERGHMRVRVNNKDVVPPSYTAADAKEGQEVTPYGSFSYWIGLNMDGMTRGGLRVYRENRLIVETELFGAQTLLGHNVIGEVFADFLPFDILKSGVDTGSPEWREIQRVMSPLVKEYSEKRAVTYKPDPGLKKYGQDLKAVFVYIAQQGGLENYLEMGRERPATKGERKREKASERRRRESNPKSIPSSDAKGALKRVPKFDFGRLGDTAKRAVLQGNVIIINQDHRAFRYFRGKGARSFLLYLVDTVFSEWGLHRESDLASFKAHMDQVLFHAAQLDRSEIRRIRRELGV